jgi:hypothetical protein
MVSLVRIRVKDLILAIVLPTQRGHFFVFAFVQRIFLSFTFVLQLLCFNKYSTNLLVNRHIESEYPIVK